jgi:hypothetical protein
MNNETNDKLRAALAKLPQEVAPGRDLWPGIAARIGRPARAVVRPLWVYGLAASLLVGVGAAGMWFSLSRQAGGPPQPASLAMSTAGGDTAYFAARAAYAEGSVQSAQNLSPATRAVILKNLRIIEGSMQDIQQALAKDPNNIQLRGLLYDLYKNEAQLMSATQQLQTRNTVRTDL